MFRAHAFLACSDLLPFFISLVFLIEWISFHVTPGLRDWSASVQILYFPLHFSQSHVVY